MVEYKKFKINEFFKVLRVRHKLTKSQLSSDGKYPCYSSETSNYGILGYTNTPEFHVDDDHSYLIFGDHTRSMRIAETDFSVLDNVKVLKGPKLSREVLLYIETAWHKGIRDMGYARHWKIAKQSDFLLPVTSAGQPDFEYMTQYIKDMEWQCVDDLKAKQKEELQAYLQVTGFTDMTLSSSEAAALTKKVVWKKFKLGSLCDFESVRQAKSQKAIPDDNNESTCIPYIVQSMSNNMFRRNVNRQYLVDHNEPIVRGNCIALGVTLPAVSYQPNEFGGSQLIIARAKSDWMNGETGLYLATAIRMHMSEFSYNRKPGMKIYKAMDVMLPVTPDGSIDFSYMQNYIRAIEKQTIKNVVKYRNDVINTTQQIVGSTF